MQQAKLRDAPPLRRQAHEWSGRHAPRRQLRVPSFQSAFPARNDSASKLVRGVRLNLCRSVQAALAHTACHRLQGRGHILHRIMRVAKQSAPAWGALGNRRFWPARQMVLSVHARIGVREHGARRAPRTIAHVRARCEHTLHGVCHAPQEAFRPYVTSQHM
jgi:hypothetical protein